ncbi:hypothetical protein SAMN04487917_101352 [Arthrobacter sp. yr096]|uniref:hypothetical protein n=1 Tax=Arthrobacter sp. yr096 TaxID=1761750 RepID=UPI0008B7471D|nr:hypothetical protein [Arthrobacter sp. yr096]SEI44935.1 hypothetical protein SAMN04487917_101352 [Arthrobacter sp. yr096]
MELPAGLGERGLSLWEAMSGKDVARNALVLEAARIADRLDELDNIIQGKGVLNLMQFRLHLNEIDEDGDRNINVEVKFAAPLAEARQQATALAAILSKLAPAESAAAKPAGKPMPAGVTPLDRIRQRNLQKA